MSERAPHTGRRDGLSADHPAPNHPDPARVERVVLPRLNPWLALLLLVLLGFGYIGLWSWLLGG